MVLVAGLQKDAKEQLGAMGIMFSTHSLAFMVASGFGGAVATRVSNELGERCALHLHQKPCLHD